MQTNLDEGSARLLHALVTVVRGAKRTAFDEPSADAGSGYLLHVLESRGSLRLTELASATRLDASTASRHARTLEERGLLERSPDPADGRATQLTVTDAGRAHLSELWDRRRGLMAGYIAGWSDDDVATLTTLLERLGNEIAGDQPAPHPDRSRP